MKTHEFTVYLDRALCDDDFDRLFDAGFDDSTPGNTGGRGVIMVNREAPSLSQAIVSVYDDAKSAGFRIVGIEDEDLVSLRTVADRIGRSYEAVRLYATGKSGPGGFPPVASGDGWALVSWAAARDWFQQSLDMELPDDERGRVLAAADHLLRAASLGVDLGALSQVMA